MVSKRLFHLVNSYSAKRWLSFSRYASINGFHDFQKHYMKVDFIRNASCSELKARQRNFDLIVLLGGVGKNENIQKLTIIDIKDYLNHQAELRLFGEDAGFVLASPNYTFLGVADGVGGYNKSGIDPAKFSYNLMKFCLNESRSFIDSEIQPCSQYIVELGYQKLLESKDPIYGGSTVLVANFDHETGKLHISNLGDSKIMIIDNLGDRVISSVSQQHYFNCPFQLGQRPDENGTRLSDSPDMSDLITHQLHHNDIIVMGSDGFFDNMFENDVVSTIDFCKKNSLQYNECFLMLLEKARKYSQDSKRQSPFTLEYSNVSQKHTIGGKEDDITVIFAVVVENK